MDIVSVTKTYNLTLDYFLFSDNEFYADSVKSFFICEEAYMQFVKFVGGYFIYRIEGAIQHGSRYFSLDGKNILGSMFVYYTFSIVGGVIKLTIEHTTTKEH